MKDETKKKIDELREKLNKLIEKQKENAEVIHTAKAAASARLKRSKLELQSC